MHRVKNALSVTVLSGVLAVGAPALTAPANAADEQPATISGLVTRAGTTTPLAGICLAAFTPGFMANSDQMCTGADGRYTLGRLTPGQWQVISDDPDGAWGSVVSALVTVTTGAQVTGVNLAIDPAATVTGVAVDRATGTPVPDSCPAVFDGRRGSLLRMMHTTCSGADGRWSVTALAPGRYTLQIHPSDGVHQPQWAKDAETQARASLTTVPAAATVDIGTVPLHRGGSITGRITDQAGRPIAGATVNYGTYTNFLGDGGNSASTDADGRYTITNVDEGQATVLVSTYGQPYAWSFSGGVDDPAKARPVSVRYDRATRFDAVLGPEAPLNVAVSGDGGMVDVFTARGDAVGFHGDAGPTWTTNIHGLPAGSYRVRVTLRNNTYTWYDGATSLATATPVRVSVGTPTSITVKAP